MDDVFQKFLIAQNILVGWACLGSIFFMGSWIYIWRKSGVSLWKEWWRTNMNSIKIERRFAVEVKQFPVLNFLYHMIKWGTLLVGLACVVWAGLVVIGTK